MPTPGHGLWLPIALAVTLGAVSAAAQTPVDDTGFKLWDGRLHVFGDGDVHYVYNPGREPAGVNVASDMALAGRVGYDYDLGKDAVQLQSDGHIEYRRFLNIEKDGTDNLSAFSGGLGINALFYKDRPLDFRLTEHLVRSSDPANQTLTVRLLHWSNDATAGVDFSPRGGALVANLEYRFFIDRYDPQAGNQGYDARLLDNWRHIPTFRLNWKFLPKTAAFIEATGIFTKYFDQAGAAVQNAPSDVWLSAVGLTGAVTRKISLLAKVGYVNASMTRMSNFQSAIGQLEVDYEARSSSHVKGGFMRTVEPTSIFQYVAITRVYADASQALFGRALLTLTAHYDALSYGLPVTATLPGNRFDNELGGTIELSYKLKPWLIVSLNDNLDLRWSSYSAANLNVGYKYNDVFLQVMVRH